MAKAMWDALQVLHEGTEDVKKSKINTLIKEYNFFCMKLRESVASIKLVFLT